MAHSRVWIFYSRKCLFFGLKVSFIEIDAQPRLFPHDHEDEGRGPQAPLDLRWGEVRLSAQLQFVSSLLAALEKKIKVGTPPLLARATQNANFLWARGRP